MCTTYLQPTVPILCHYMHNLPTAYRTYPLSLSGGAPVLYMSYWDCIRKILQNEGWAAMYRGLGITIFRGVPNTGTCLARAIREGHQGIGRHACVLHGTHGTHSSTHSTALTCGVPGELAAAAAGIQFGVYELCKDLLTYLELLQM